MNLKSHFQLLDVYTLEVFATMFIWKLWLPLLDASIRPNIKKQVESFVIQAKLPRMVVYLAWGSRAYICLFVTITGNPWTPKTHGKNAGFLIFKTYGLWRKGGFPWKGGTTTIYRNKNQQLLPPVFGSALRLEKHRSWRSHLGLDGFLTQNWWRKRPLHVVIV